MTTASRSLNRIRLHRGASSVVRTTETAEPPVTGRWSARRTLVFAVVACGGFWLAVAALVMRLSGHH